MKIHWNWLRVSEKSFENVETTDILPRSLNWLVGCLGFNGPLRQYFRLYRAVSKREGEGGKKG